MATGFPRALFWGKYRNILNMFLTCLRTLPRYSTTVLWERIYASSISRTSRMKYLADSTTTSQNDRSNYDVTMHEKLPCIWTWYTLFILFHYFRLSIESLGASLAQCCCRLYIFWNNIIKLKHTKQRFIIYTVWVLTTHLHSVGVDDTFTQCGCWRQC